ncbi:enhancer of mRNA-decapping protein 4 homolog Ge-1 [Choristoneura fumiferana]|uniref:enhancer of mRNA-decapping protein 4 homolog Ge-1 n=1 Tax=Choristoneura fumiferana TaxID=7141 RepID=UPI003D15A71C
MQPTAMLPKLTDSTQTISFSEGDGVCSSEVFASDVVVTTNAGNHNHGSSKVKLKNLVDYNWEPKFYSGNLLAVHMSGKYLAYCIKAPNTMNPGTWTGMVRVVYNPEMGNDRRALIKGMKGEVQDLAFAHIHNQVVLACIDEHGNFYVHEIELTDSGLRCTLACEIREDTMAGGSHRVVWCPYIPDDHDADPDDVARLLLTTHNNKARMWSIGTVVASLAASEGRGVGSQLSAAEGAVAAGEHGAAIVDAAFSPDGTALATAAADGLVMFYQVYTHSESSPRCLHKWQPHGGAPLSCLSFLDNHNNTDTDIQFWKFAMTGAENNTIIKIWSCKSWNCLQTITFTPGLGAEPTAFGLKAMLDASANYLLLSDFKTRSLYVLNMARDKDDTMAYCKSISEFLLPYPVLSFYIFDAEEVQGKCESSCDDPFHRNGSGGDVGHSPDEFDLHHDEVESGGCGLGRRARLRLYVVQPKGLQEAELVYEPPPRGLAQPASPTHGVSELVLEEESAAPALASSILQQQSQQLKNLLMRSQTQPGSLISQRPESPPSIPQPLNLMTPDAFSSPGKRDEDDPPLSATPDVSGKPRMSTGSMSAEGGAAEAAPKFTSGGSSPSREVQEIMSHNDDDTYYKENMEEEEEEEASSRTAAADSEPGPEPYPELPAPPALPGLPAPPQLPPLPNNDTTWPQISLAQITEANQRKASSDKSGSQSLNKSGERDASVSPQRREALEQKLDQLTEQVAALSRSVSSLRNTVSVTVPGAVRAAADEALQAHAPATAAALETALTHGWERIARVGETASARAASAAGMGAARALEPLAAALQHELAAKLSATDGLLQDNIQKMVTSKSVTERLSASVSQAVSAAVRDAFRDAIRDSVVPAVERAHHDMFRQLSQTFHQGLREFAANTEASARAAVERGSASAANALRAAITRHCEALCAAPPPLDHQHLAAMLRDTVRPVLEKEVEWWVRQARSVQMSRAHSPATPAASQTSAHDRQMQVAQIQSLISSGDVNGAFQLALSASDLALVMAACRAADPARVFAPPCQLRQHVLLSLVQQLAADMPRDTALKHRYLEEAIMNLDTSNAVTREHLPVVLRELHKQLVAFLAAHPAHALARKFRMLLIVADSLANTQG